MGYGKRRPGLEETGGEKGRKEIINLDRDCRE